MATGVFRRPWRSPLWRQRRKALAGTPLVYTISAGTGAFTLTGQAAALLASYRLPPDAGSFALTGQDATLYQAYFLAAGAGAFTLAGQGAEFLASYRIPAEAGSFALTGQDATLYQAYFLAAGAGAFTLAGQDAGLLVSYRILPEAGAFTLAGQDAGLLVSYRIPPEAGAFTLAGQDAGLLVSYRILPEAGAFTLAGQDVALLASRVIPIEAGSFALSGQDATLQHNYLLATGAGAFTLTGFPTYYSIQRFITFRVELEFSANSIMDVTEHVLAASWERSIGNFVNGLESGTADLVLANDLGSLSPLNMPANMFRPNVGVAIDVSPYLDAPYQTMFTGLVDRVTVNPALSGPRNIVISCRDRTKDLARRRIDTAIQTEVNVGSLVALVLDSASITSRSIDAIGDSIPFAWFRDRQVTTAVQEIVEAGGYSAYVAGDGTFRFRDRFFDLGGTVVGSYDTFGSMKWEMDEVDVVNRVRVRGEPRTIVSSTQTVAALAEVLSIPASESVGFWLEFQDPRNQEAAPAIGVVTPVASVDWILNAQADNSGAVLTSGGSLSFTAFAETAVATVTNQSTVTAYLTLFQVQGQPIQREPYLSVQADYIASQSLYGIKDATLETRMFGTRDRLENRAADILDLFGEPTPKVAITLTNVWPDILTHELADILYISEDNTGVADQFTIQSMQHQIDAEDRGWVHSVTYELDRSKAVSPLILDDADDGLLDSDRLGRVTA